jgi:uncharacterized caspase-like protein
MLASNSTRIFLVGISQYQTPDLRLRFSASNACDLQQAFAFKDGCAIPIDHVTILCDESATRSDILAELQKTACACDVDDVFIFYFSGHGEREDSHFYLLPFDAEVAALSTTAIGFQDLKFAFSSCRARGILLILDCCKSAGFAENAVAFFNTLSASDFR